MFSKLKNIFNRLHSIPKADNRPSILITGGLGFFFSHVTEYFVKKGWRVIVIDNLSEGSNPDIIDGSFTLQRTWQTQRLLIL